ncbi:hypothetical protein BO70DRAFT_423472 [Aspergillus heteromorphus CBS 117.55]|uniref:Uncharacterized protein n=1 Tax=Aspergillus heteromorphus CBS 117.55 TaxID=1448321 RepID=A0A317WIL3_9EURO|nr:uncharacterized protein BO70DRAFT_423472 [Aspergillus heteromorphus CBS 117.55]PWY86213.1 hypothetical protein BO70DRAFT_423472 [Aspergillus heteromorphus CBS 117.55]
MSLPVDLGEAHFTSPTSVLTLTLHASVQMLLSEREASWMDAVRFQRLLKHSNVWVSPTPELKLYLTITTSTAMALPVSAFVSRIGEILCSSKVYFTHSCDNLHQDISLTFRLAFGIQRDDKQPLRMRRARKEALFDQHGDVSPPIHISTIQLSTINISLGFDRPTPIYIPPVLNTKPCPSEEQLESQTPLPNLDEYEHEYEYEEDVILLEDQPKMAEPDSNSEVLSFMEELSDLSWSEQNSSISISQDSFPGISQPEIQHEDLYNIFTMSLESLLFGRHSNYNDPGTGNLQCLSNIAPSVFSPGYHRAMTQRSQLIPTINKSIASLLNLPMNHSLQHKINRLKASNRSQSSTTNTLDIKNILGASLWRIAQKQLYKPQASQKLSLLEPLSDLRTKYQDRGNTLITNSQLAETEDHMLDNDYNNDDILIDSDSGSLLHTNSEDPGPQTSERQSSIMSLHDDSSVETLRFEPSEDESLLVERFGDDVSDCIPFSSNLSYYDRVDSDDDMLCDYI